MGKRIPLHIGLTIPRVHKAVERSNAKLERTGFCVHCGCETHPCDDYAQRLECWVCGKEDTVYGCAFLLREMIAANDNRKSIVRKPRRSNHHG